VRLSRSLGEDDGGFPLSFLFFLSVKTDIAVSCVKSLRTIINRPFGSNANPVAWWAVRRYGKCHDDAFERDELVVGLLTAARLRMRVGKLVAATENPGGHLFFRCFPDPSGNERRRE
jgi:hypothetical protein